MVENTTGRCTVYKSLKDFVMVYLHRVVSVFFLLFVLPRSVFLRCRAKSKEGWTGNQKICQDTASC